MAEAGEPTLQDVLRAVEGLRTEMRGEIGEVRARIDGLGNRIDGWPVKWPRSDATFPQD